MTKLYTKPSLRKLTGKDKKQAKVTFEYAQYCQIVKRMLNDNIDEQGYWKK